MQTDYELEILELKNKYAELKDTLYSKLLRITDKKDTADKFLKFFEKIASLPSKGLEEQNIEVFSEQYFKKFEKEIIDGEFYIFTIENNRLLVKEIIFNKENIKKVVENNLEPGDIVFGFLLKNKDEEEIAEFFTPIKIWGYEKLEELKKLKQELEKALEQ